MKTPEQIAAEAMSAFTFISGFDGDEEDNDVEEIDYYYIKDQITAAIEADRAQLDEQLRRGIRFHNDDASNPEYLRGQVEMAAYIIGYSDPGGGDALREDLTTEAGK